MEGAKKGFDKELRFLIADYLERSTPCSKAAKALREELEGQALLGEVTTWHGQRRAATVEDFRGRYAEVAPNQLERIVRTVLTEKSRQTKAEEEAEATALEQEDLRLQQLQHKHGEGDEDATGTAGDTAAARAHARWRTPRSAAAFLLKDPRGLLVSQRQLATSSSENAATLVKLLENMRKTKAELKKLQLGALPEGAGGEATTLSYVTKRIADRKAKLESLTAEVEELRFTLRDPLLDRQRRSTNVLDLISTAQVGRRIGGKLVGPTRELACRRLRVMKKIYGHRAYVFCVTSDRSGQWIVTGSDDSLCKLWNARTGELCRTFRGHEKMICDVAIDNTNKYLASCSVDETVRLWELETGRHVAVLNAHSKGINVVEFDPKENMILTASDDGLCCIWDTTRIVEEDERAIASMSEERRPQRQGEASGSRTDAGSQELVSAEALAEAGITTQFLSPKAPVVLPHLNVARGGLSEVNAMAVCPQGGFIATGCEDGVARIWAVSRNVPSRCAARSVSQHAATKPNLVEGEYVDGAARLICTMRGHLNSIAIVEWSKKGDRVLTGSAQDGTVRIWYWRQREAVSGAVDMLTTPHQRLLQVQRGSTRAFSSAAGHGNATAAATMDGGRQRSSNKYKVPSLDTCTWSGDDSFVIVLQSKKQRKNWDQTEYEDLVEFFDQRVLIFNSYTGQIVHNIGAHRKPAYVVRAHPTDKHLFMTGGHDGQILVWDVYEGRILSKLPISSQFGPLTVLDGTFTPAGSSSASIVATDIGGRLILIGSEDGTVYSGAYPEQFFKNDYAELLRDGNGHVLDARSQLPPHLVPREAITDSQGVDYQVQPQPTGEIFRDGLFSRNTRSVEEQELNRVERRKAVKQLEIVLHNSEQAAMHKLRHRFLQVDERIAQSNRTTAQSVVSARSGSRSPQREHRGPQSQQQQWQAPRSVPFAAASPNRSRTSQAQRQQSFEQRARSERPRLLACERALADVEALEAAEANRAGVSSSGDRGDANDSGEVEHEDPSTTSGGRRRRSAARRAQGRIRVFQELESAPQVHGPNLSSGEDEDARDGQWDAPRDAEDDEDDDLDDDFMADAYDQEGNRGRRSRRRARLPRRFDEEAGLARSRSRRTGSRNRHLRSEFNYNEVSSGSSDEEMFDAPSSPENQRPRRSRQRPKNASRQSAKRMPLLDEDRYFDRRWLSKTTKPAAHEPYCPQVGDLVVYFAQGHADFLRAFPVSDLAPFQRPWWLREWAMVLCRVTDIKYTFPSAEAQASEHEGSNRITVLCSLEIVKTPGPGLLKGTLPVDPTEMWSEVKAAEGAENAPLKFEVHYQAHSGAEFLLLKERVEVGMQQELKPGDRVRAVYSGARGEPRFFAATVDEISVSDDDWPHSPWEMVMLRWDEGDLGRQSPWELRKGRHISDFDVELRENATMTPALSGRCADKVEHIIKTEQCTSPFVDPVDLDQVPGYGSIIALPMDLRTILDRLHSQYYRHLDAVKADAQVISENCFAFNKPEALICTYAAQLVPLLEDTLSELAAAPRTRSALLRSNGPSRSTLRGGKSLREESEEEEEEEEEDEEDDGEEDHGAGLGNAAQDGRNNRKRSGSLRRVAIDDLMRAFETMLKAMERKDRHGIFAEPVREEDVPGYHEQITQPMDLGTIRQKLVAGEYGNAGKPTNVSRDTGISIARALEADLLLLCANAITFNEAGSPVFNLALKLKDVVLEHMTAIGKDTLGLNEWKCQALPLEDEHLLDSDSEEEEAATSDRNKSNEQRRARRRRNAAATDEDDDDDGGEDASYGEEDEDVLASSSEEEQVYQRSRPRRGTQRKRKAARPARRRRQPPAKRQARRSRRKQEVDSESSLSTGTSDAEDDWEGSD
ncbi:Bromodomain and WD repeat-containing protein 1 (WD repeat-containing protein 9) [Durusdinium trenchii]|uniref:Bromodomain and WD repeat-containing protein 1 (WD repeat-containing protein 9) n=1 Tax=Durusdinium trenchii TaxID=1381693 RepID=A0ABP0H7H9_9DINO